MTGFFLNCNISSKNRRFPLVQKLFFSDRSKVKTGPILTSGPSGKSKQNQIWFKNYQIMSVATCNASL
jgi:hypothetical protein